MSPASRPPRRFGPGPEARARLRERLPERLRVDLDVDADATARWPADHRGPVVFLVVADGSLERRLVERWIRRQAPEGADASVVSSIPIPDPHAHRAHAVDARLVARLADARAGPERDADTLLVPLRVVWLPPERDGERTARLRDLVTLGDPRTPGALRQRLVAGRERDRARIISGEPATVARLRDDFARHAALEPTGPTTAAAFAAFVARRAGLALEQAEWRMLGTRYKVPSLVVDDMLGRADFRQGLEELAGRLGRPVGELREEAAGILEEMAAGHSRYMIDLSADFARWMYTQAYDEAIHYDRERFEEIKVLVQRYPVVFLPSHKSYLDPVVMRWIFHQQGLPPNHTAAGRNMNFWPIGPIYRRAGAFFIRRSFKDDPVYRFVVREYVGYLIEKRFHLEWYLEGGRSRSGKLLPPKLGLLRYVVDAYREGRADDIVFQPIAIAYDQLSEVGAYAAEAHGAAKRVEGFRFLVEYVRNLRTRYGRVYVNFGEPLSLRDALGPPSEVDPAADDDLPRDLQKLAFEVAVRINRVTPITPTSLVTLAMLGTGSRALSLGEITAIVTGFGRFVADRALPTTEALHLDSADTVRTVLDALVRHKVATTFGEGPDRVYRIGADQQIAAAYYRNTIAHFFVTPAIAELALLRAAEERPPGDPRPSVTVFWDEVFELRDLLKHDFFFADKEVFRREVSQELTRQEPAWADRLAEGPDAVQQLVAGFHPFSAHRVLRPFVDAYQVVADVLVDAGERAVGDERQLVGDALARAKEHERRGLVASNESASRVLLEAGLRLAQGRHLDEEGPALATRRLAFARELADVTRRVRAVAALAASRRAGLIG